MLGALIEAAGEIVTENSLSAAVWDHMPGPSALTNCYMRIQRTLEEIDTAVRVQRLPGTGYRVVEIRESSVNEPQ